MKTRKWFFILLIGFIILGGPSTSGQDLMDILEEEIPETTSMVAATFKGTRIGTGHSVETRKRGVLEFLISHRFGRTNGGFYELFGLDESNIRFALEYAATDRLTVAVGRSSFDKSYDGYIKYRLLQQSSGAQSFPISMTILSSMAAKTLKDYLPEDKPSLGDRMAYTAQALIARKINENLSLQISPTYIHRKELFAPGDPKHIFALGMGGRMKITSQVAINAEYYHNFNPIPSISPTNALTLGIDIETGGHVFQLLLTNAITMIEKSFITETRDEFFKGDIHLGFNISRAFHLAKKERRSQW